MVVIRELRGKVRTGGRKFTPDETDERKRGVADEIVKSALRYHDASISFRSFKRP